MIEFSFMDKREKDALLPELFTLLYENMNEIAPSGEDPADELRGWLEAVSPALDRTERRIVLIKDDGRLVGYFQYYVNEATFMMEEIQFERELWGSGLFAELYAFLRGEIPPVPFVEAYAHKLNAKSQGILEHIGLERIGENKNGSCFHYRGDCGEMWSRVLKK